MGQAFSAQLPRRVRALGAVADADLASAFGFRTKVPALSLDANLARPEITGVAIATPAESHARRAVKSLDSGKHVFLTKPLPPVVADAEEVIERGEHAGRMLMVEHLLQRRPALPRLKGWRVAASRVVCSTCT